MVGLQPVAQATNASGYGSSSEPKVASEPSVLRMDTPHTVAPVETPKRGKTLPLVIVAVFVLSAVGIGVVALGMKNEGSTGDAAKATAQPSATMVAHVEPAVVPIETVKAAASAAVPEPAAQLVDAGVDAGVDAVVSAAPVNPAKAQVALTVRSTPKKKALDVGGRK
jgi:hypothetical protein